MLVNLLLYIAFGMFLVEKSSRYFFVLSVPEDDSSLGSLVFVSAVDNSVVCCTVSNRRKSVSSLLLPMEASNLLQRILFIISLNTAALSHSKAASSGTCCDCCCVQGDSNHNACMVYSLSFLDVAPVKLTVHYGLPDLDMRNVYRETHYTVVIKLYRHGDRTPVTSYPTDPYNNLSYWPNGWGQLTNLGKDQHYVLGQWLRQRYSGFLPEEYSREDIYVRSTDVDRTLMSAASNLAGLYPPDGEEMWNKNINWQPIPIHTVPETKDKILAGKFPCARYNAELQRVKTSPEMRRYDEEHADLYRYTSEQSGKSIHDAETLEYLYNTLFIEELYNLTLPNWTQAVYPEKMMSVAAYSFTIPAKTKVLQRLKIGPLVKEIIRHMMDKQDAFLKPSYKMIMYSAHDTTVANFLMALDVFDPQNPPYISLVLVELWKNDNGKYLVQVLYRNSTTHEPYNLAIPGCDAVCPLEKFAELLEPVIPDNWEKECKMGIFYYVFDFSSVAIMAVMVSGILAVLLLFSMVFGITYWMKHKATSGYYYQQLEQNPN